MPVDSYLVVAHPLGIALRTHLEAVDADRPRSKQTSIGASQLGGCRRQVWLKIDGAPEINETDKLAALMGTAIHSMIEEAFRRADPAGKRYLLEVTVPGLPDIGLGDAHVDCYDIEDEAVNDWKSITKKNAAYFGSQKQWWQVSTYGHRMIAAGYPVKKVRLVGIPRDGTFNDLMILERPYDERLALQAMGWLENLWTWDRSTGLPPADLSGRICTEFCPFYGPEICMGKP